MTKKAALTPADNAYRDRALERRVALNQPEKPSTEPPRKKWRTDTVKPAQTVKPNQQGITEDNRGHKLLAAAGWNKGESLGLGSSTGLVAPIEAVSYATGAGIGAAKGLPISNGEDNVKRFKALRYHKWQIHSWNVLHTDERKLERDTKDDAMHLQPCTEPANHH